AEAQHEHFQRADAEQRQSLGQIRNRSAGAEERAIDHPKNAGRQRRVTLETTLERGRIDPRLASESEHLGGSGGQGIELPCALDELFNEADGFGHARSSQTTVAYARATTAN